MTLILVSELHDLSIYLLLYAINYNNMCNLI